MPTIQVIIYGFTAQGLKTELGQYLFDSFQDIADELDNLKAKKPSIVRYLVDIAV